MSPLHSFQQLAAQIAYKICRAFEERVGESRGTSTKSGSVYPRTTRRAFAFFGSSGASSGGPFHVRCQRMRIIRSRGTPFASTGMIGSVDNHESTSFSFASSNYARSPGVHLRRDTSMFFSTLRDKTGTSGLVDPSVDTRDYTWKHISGSLT